MSWEKVPVTIDRMTNYGKAARLASRRTGQTLTTANEAAIGWHMRYLVLLGLIVGGLLGYYVLWSHLADQVAAQAEAWIDGQRRLGREVSYENRRIWGFPYRLSLTLTKARWSDPRQPLAPRLEADEVTAHLQLWQREHIIFDLPGKQNALWRDGTAERRTALAAERFRASLVVDGAGNWLRIAADLSKPRLQGPAEGALRGEWVADKLLLHARRAGNVPPSMDLALQLDQAMMPPHAEKPFGRALQGLRLTGNLRGGFYGTTPEDLLASWRDAGGVMDLSTIQLTWGDLSLSGTGTLAIDRDFRPLGAMSGTIDRATEAIDALATNRLISVTTASNARKIALGQEERTDNKGQALRPLTLTVQDGQLFYRDIPLLSVPSVLPGR